MMQLSPYLLAIAAAWIIAQGSKFLISSVRQQGPVDYRQLYSSGSMPSGHSATAVALMTVVGLREGIDGGLFAIAVLVAAVLMYDAVMVRRSAGEQGAAIQALIKEQKSQVSLPRAAKGHEPMEVAAGALLGLTVGLFVFFLTK